MSVSVSVCFVGVGVCRCCLQVSAECVRGARVCGRVVCMRGGMCSSFSLRVWV